MSIEHTQAVYNKVLEELMKEIREDPLIQSHLDGSTIDMVGNLWRDNLNRSGTFNNQLNNDTLRIIAERGANQFSRGALGTDRFSTLNYSLNPLVFFSIYSSRWATPKMLSLIGSHRATPAPMSSPRALILCPRFPM